MSKNIQKMQRRASEIEGRLSEIDQQSAPLAERAEVLTANIAQLSEEVRARDWVLTGRRPPGATADGSEEKTHQRRRQLHAQRVERERELRDVQSQVSTLHSEANALRNELATLQRDMVTPEGVAAEIEKAEGELSRLDAQRRKLSQALDAALNQQATIEADIAAEPEATATLERARADAYLSPDDAGLTSALEAAETAAVLVRENAAGARAAASQVAAKVDKAREVLAAHDAAAQQRRKVLEGLQGRRKVLQARQEVAAAADAYGRALAVLLAADEAGGLRLLDAVSGQGLRVLDGDGHLCRPEWLTAWDNDGPRPARLRAVGAALDTLGL